MTSQNSNTASDEFDLDSGRLSRLGRLAIRLIFTVGGGLAVLLGAFLLIFPGRTIKVAAVVLGIYFIVVGALRLGFGIFGRLHSSQHRTLGILFGLLMVIAGIIILRDSAAAAATLLVVVVLFTGIGWIIDGVLSIVESRNTISPGWAVGYGILCLVAGIVVLAVPGWSVVWLIIYAAVSLILLGVVGLIRGLTFGRGRQPAATATTQPA